jgi:hypothetical protein
MITQIRLGAFDGQCREWIIVPLSFDGVLIGTGSEGTAASSVELRLCLRPEMLQMTVAAVAGSPQFESGVPGSSGANGPVAVQKEEIHDRPKLQKKWNARHVDRERRDCAFTAGSYGDQYADHPQHKHWLDRHE